MKVATWSGKITEVLRGKLRIDYDAPVTDRSPEGANWRAESIGEPKILMPIKGARFVSEETAAEGAITEEAAAKTKKRALSPTKKGINEEISVGSSSKAKKTKEDSTASSTSEAKEANEAKKTKVVKEDAAEPPRKATGVRRSPRAVGS